MKHRKSTAVARQRQAAKIGVDLRLQNVHDKLERSGKSKKMRDDVIEAYYHGVDSAILNSCEKTSDVISPATLGVKGILKVSPVYQFAVVPTFIPAHFYKHIFWRAEWPIQLACISEHASEISLEMKV